MKISITHSAVGNATEVRWPSIVDPYPSCALHHSLGWQMTHTPTQTFCEILPSNSRHKWAEFIPRNTINTKTNTQKIVIKNTQSKW